MLLRLDEETAGFVDGVTTRCFMHRQPHAFRAEEPLRSSNPGFGRNPDLNHVRHSRRTRHSRPEDSNLLLTSGAPEFGRWKESINSPFGTAAFDFRVTTIRYCTSTRYGTE